MREVYLQNTVYHRENQACLAIADEGSYSTSGTRGTPWYGTPWTAHTSSYLCASKPKM